MTAYGPSPQPVVNLMAPTGSTNLHALSPSPPPMSKRDKRRHAMTDRLHDIGATFAENREYHYRQQLQALQRDANLITNADPYRNRPLDDLLENVEPDYPISTAGSRGQPHGPSLSNGERPPQAGKWARKFVEEVNTAMEDRDAHLSSIVFRHNFRIRELKDDYEYNVGVADKECVNLLNTLRTRLTQNVMQKKAALLKEKDRFELSDTTSLLLNPNQFAFTNPASPGGPQSNRKTRHGRHHKELDDVGLNGENKRKRKLAMDIDEGSPGPAGRVPEAEAPTSSKDVAVKTDPYPPVAPSYSMGYLFTDKELVQTTQEASYATLQEISAKRKRSSRLQAFDKDTVRKMEALTPRTDRVQKLGKNGNKYLKHNNNGSTNPTTANVSDVEDNIENNNNNMLGQTDGADEDSSDDIFLTAPLMDRTANSSIHATRSTRNNHLSFLNNNDNPLRTLGDLAGRAHAVRYLGSYARERKWTMEESNRAPPLTDEEAEDDLALIAAAMEEGKISPGKMNLRLADDLCAEEVDWTNDGGIEDSDVRGSRGTSVMA
ncbi:MAG: hypothetical protein Q9220_003183 [cf. Caloplaca sp. 1 TL-2023]